MKSLYATLKWEAEETVISEAECTQWKPMENDK